MAGSNEAVVATWGDSACARRVGPSLRVPPSPSTAPGRPPEQRLEREVRAEWEEVEVDETNLDERHRGERALRFLDISALEHHDRAGGVGAEVPLADHSALVKRP